MAVHVSPLEVSSVQEIKTVKRGTLSLYTHNTGVLATAHLDIEFLVMASYLQRGWPQAVLQGA